MVVEIQSHQDYQQAVDTLLYLAETYSGHSKNLANQANGTVQTARDDNHLRSAETCFKVSDIFYSSSTVLPIQEINLTNKPTRLFLNVLPITLLVRIFSKPSTIFTRTQIGIPLSRIGSGRSILTSADASKNRGIFLLMRLMMNTTASMMRDVPCSEKGTEIIPIGLLMKSSSWEISSLPIRFL